MKLKTPSNFGFKSIILIFVLFLSICAVTAHQPRLDTGGYLFIGQ